MPVTAHSFSLILVESIRLKASKQLCSSTKVHTVMAFPKDSSTGFVCMILSSQIFTAARHDFCCTLGGPLISNSGKWVFIEIPYWTCNNPDGHCYREGAWGGHNQVVHGLRGVCPTIPQNGRVLHFVNGVEADGRKDQTKSPTEQKTRGLYLHIYTSWWLNQPLWKMLVKLDHLPQVGLKKKHVWNHHPGYITPIFLAKELAIPPHLNTRSGVATTKGLNIWEKATCPSRRWTKKSRQTLSEHNVHILLLVKKTWMVMVTTCYSPQFVLKTTP